MTTMRRYFRLILCFCALLIATAVAGQTIKWQELYKVKKKDTIYGIAKKFKIASLEGERKSFNRGKRHTLPCN